MPNSFRRALRSPAALLLALLCAGCVPREDVRPSVPPADVRAQLARRLPAGVSDRAAWAADIERALRALDLPPSPENQCASIAVIEQESNFAVDPAVPNLGRIARAEIGRRAESHHIPDFAVSAALKLKSPNGKSYEQRLASARTERDLSLLYEDMIGELPLGQRLFADANPVHTAGPMQVSIAYAEEQVRDRDYPYTTRDSIRHEVFTRRGGVYFGVAHLLGYPADYPAMLYRFADFNAGLYASRNAAFQKAVSLLSGVPLALDGDLVLYDAKGDEVGATEAAVRKLAKKLDLSANQIHRALQQSETEDFSHSTLYERVFALADARAEQPRAVMPKIALHSPKITRSLTTEWFATRVNQRYEACLAKGAPAPRK